MKSYKLALIATMLWLHNQVYSQQVASLDSSNYYVVIGAFSIHNNASRFVSYATTLDMSADYGWNAARNLYYVYVLRTENRDKALLEAAKLRTDSTFYDVWIYRGSTTAEEGEAVGDIDPVSNQIMTHVVSADSPVREAETSHSPESVRIAENTATPVVESIDDHDGKRFFFKIYREGDETPVAGEIDAINVSLSRKIGTYKGNTSVLVSAEGKPGDVSFVCEIFGYRKVQTTVDFNDPLALDGISQDSSSNIVVPFGLTRLRKGDIAVMYNVYFFKDAAVMRPESHYEINSLLEMLRENPRYKIKIHGHTNGNSYGKIIYGGDSKNFFSLANSHDGFGSAKELSEERAKIIRDFMMSNGIDKSRMQIKAWGGKRPVQNKNGSKAQENVRVEVEILED
ncbi:MAG TPA: OmpA family protein [Ohtaekwangia sp.]|uniref:OmpA family protein n=1 Tax=Ohtaekwangia sp. TaxID=2066019 RepID=UPI002F953105